MLAQYRGLDICLSVRRYSIACTPLPLPNTPRNNGGRIRSRREELHDAFHVSGDHRQVKLDLHLEQGPVPRPGETVKMFEFGHLGLDPAALALIIPNPAIRPHSGPGHNSGPHGSRIKHERSSRLSSFHRFLYRRRFSLRDGEKKRSSFDPFYRHRPPPFRRVLTSIQDGQYPQPFHSNRNRPFPFLRTPDSARRYYFKRGCKIFPLLGKRREDKKKSEFATSWVDPLFSLPMRPLPSLRSKNDHGNDDC